MNENQIKMMRNALGPAIFTFGAIGVAMVVMTLIKGMPSEDATNVGAFGRGLVGFLGAFPLAFMGLGAAFLGARLFILGMDLRLGRNLLGLVLVSLGFSIFLATILPNAGGVFGEAIGGTVRRSARVPVAVAFIFGVVSLAAPIWFMFLREQALQFMASATPPTVEKSAEVEAAGGLSRAEAEALLPDDEALSPSERASKSGELAKLLATQKDKRPEWLEESGYPQAPSPYAEDVRHSGGIPEGAAPLAPQDTSSHESSPAPTSVHRWTPESLRMADDALGADLAEVEPAVAAAGTQAPEPASGDEKGPVEAEVEAQELTPAPVKSVEPVAQAQPVAKPVKAPDRPTDPSVKVLPLEQVNEGSKPAALTPSWEQSSLFEDPVAEEELDALEEEEELEEEEDEDEAAELEEDEEWEEEDEEELDPAAEYEEDEEEDEEEYEDDDEAAAEYEEEDEDEEEYEDDPEAEYEEDEEDEEEYEEDEELDPAAELEEDEEEDEDEELDPAAELEEDEEEEEDEELDPAAELEENEEDEEEEAEALAELEVAEEDSPEPEVVLTPQAPPESASTDVEKPTTQRVTDQVIYESGELFLDRERVAVSMLQREFSLDFDESCEVMDRLQSMGLIGPYVGGHRRDILMTKDQWMERATQ